MKGPVKRRRMLEVYEIETGHKLTLSLDDLTPEELFSVLVPARARNVASYVITEDFQATARYPYVQIGDKPKPHGRAIVDVPCQFYSKA